MTHIEDKHAEDQGVIAAIGYFKFWVSYNCQRIKPTSPSPFQEKKNVTKNLQMKNI
jgi:hypothetical protein